MRILLLSEMIPPDSDGGQEVNALKIAVGLRARGHDVIIGSSAFRPSYNGPDEDRPWVRRVFRHIPLQYAAGSKSERFKAISGYYGEYKTVKANIEAMKKLVAEVKPDVVYCFGLSRVGVAVTAVASDQGIPVLWHQGGNYLENRFEQTPRMGRPAKFFRDLVAEEKRVDYSHIAYVSQFLIDDSRSRGFIGSGGRGAKTLEILPRGIEFAVADDVDRERDAPPVLLMAGRIAPMKGFHNAIDALGALHERRPDLDWRLVILGEPENADVSGDGILGTDYLAQLKSQAAKLGIGDRVQFPGKVTRDELQTRIRRATVFVSASICGEAFANTIIETLANGTPLVVSADGSALEVVEDEVSALVYEPSDVESLSAHIERMLLDGELRTRLAKGGCETIRARFTLNAILDRTEAILGKVAHTGSNSKTIAP